jgi:outer membrane protein assembly factor BamB
MRLSLAWALAAALILVGCSKDKDVEPPAALVVFPQKLPVKELWSDKVGGGKKQVKLRLGLSPAVDNNLVFAGSDQGELVALNLDTGRQVWIKKYKRMQVSAGPAAALGMVVFGTTKGFVIALEGSSGKELWRTRVNSELLSAPAISEKVVVMRAVDGHLHGFDASNGKELWSVEQQVPRLSLRGTAIPVIAKEVAVSGFDNGKVMAVSLNTGDKVWDTALATPHGRTELDRLVDVDSAVSVVGDNVFASGFQGRTAMIALDSGQIWWAHDMSSYRGLATDGENLFVTQSDGVVVALRQRDGSEVWHNDKLKRRALSAPAVTSTAIVVADFQGYLHWLDRSTGELVARQRVAKFRVSSAPVAVHDTVVVLTDSGRLAAFRATPKVAAAAAPAAVAPEPAAPADSSVPAPTPTPPASAPPGAPPQSEPPASPPPP